MKPERIELLKAKDDLLHWFPAATLVVAERCAPVFDPLLFDFVKWIMSLGRKRSCQDHVQVTSHVCC